MHSRKILIQALTAFKIKSRALTTQKIEANIPFTLIMKF